MKLIFNLFIFISFIFADSELDIETKKKELSQKSKEKKDVSKKIEEIAKDILSINRELAEFDKKIKEIDEILEKNKKNYDLQKEELTHLQKREVELVENKQEIEKNIILLIAKDLSISVVINTSSPANITDLIKEEVFYAVGKITRESIKELKKELSETQSELETKRDVALKIKSYIDELDDNRLRQVSLKNKKADLLLRLSEEEISYKKKLSDILAQQENIRTVLESLAYQQSESSSRVEVSKKSFKESVDLDVRQIGTSYLKTKTTSYSGEKGMAPLDDFLITKKFGTFFDPIYKIKIFNESVTFQSKYQNARVKSILDGEVVFVGDTPMLKTVVIIKHNNGIHSVYGYLSQTAPTIQVGKKLQQGYVIGRVYDDLLFEVTKRDYHIDPLTVISLN